LDSEKLFCTIVDDKDTIFLHFKHYFARGGRCAKTFKNLYFMTKFALLFLLLFCFLCLSFLSVLTVVRRLELCLIDFFLDCLETQKDVLSTIK